MQYYPQQPQNRPQQGQPVRQYPPYPVQQPPYIQPYYVQPQLTPEQQRAADYRKSLRRTVNSLGVLLLIFFALELILSAILGAVLAATGTLDVLSDTEIFTFLENGLISSVIFFLFGLIYCLIRRVRFAQIFPFDKVRGAFLAQICVIGLSFSLMSNYIVTLVNNTFGLFGVENSGGDIASGSAPDILLYFLTVAVLPAFAEEFAFRGIVMGSLRPYSEGLAILISSATFALMHGNFVQLPFTFGCGLVFAYIDIKTNSLLPSIIVHFLNNGLAVLSDVLISYQIMDEYGVNLCYGAIFVITGILSFIFLRRIIKDSGNSLFTLRGGNDEIPFKSKVTTAASSPTLITFAVMMVLFCILSMFGVL